MTYNPDLSIPLFYLTTHRPHWLWGGQADYPLMVSYQTLRQVRNVRPAAVPGWALDSGGFTELTRFGTWTVSAPEYVASTARYDREIGGLGWAAPQDWMCEPEVIRGGIIAGRRVPGTGLSVAEHQRRTIASFAECTALWDEHSDAESPFVPVLQGYSPGSYQEHKAMYDDAGITLTDYPLVGVGSVCRRSSTSAITDIARAIDEMRAELPPVHWFGVALDGIRRARLTYGDVKADGEWWEAGTGSLDSASWSYDARRGDRLPGCTHVSPATREPSSCTNCPVYAAVWRQRVINTLYAVYDAGQRLPDRAPQRGAWAGVASRHVMLRRPG